MAQAFRAALLWLFIGLGGPADAAPYPAYGDLYVNDLAEVLGADEAASLRADLEGLNGETGVEMTVLTIPTRGDYEAGGTLEDFATGLFNDWGVGRADRNDGILVLVAVEDRETRIVLGNGYDQGYDVLAQDIVTRWFLPEFRDGNYGAGIAAGSGEVMARIARRHAEGLAPGPVPRSDKGLISRLMPWLVGAVFAGVIGKMVLGRQIGDWSYRFRRCPACGRRGLHREHVPPLDPAQPTTGRIVTRCPSCRWREERPWKRAVGTASRRASGGGGSFGGGKSSGGGASGRW